MPTRSLTDLTGLPAHRRQVALVRWSLIAVPDRTGRPERGHDRRDSLNWPDRTPWTEDHATW